MGEQHGGLGRSGELEPAISQEAGDVGHDRVPREAVPHHVGPTGRQGLQVADGVGDGDGHRVDPRP